MPQNTYPWTHLEHPFQQSPKLPFQTCFPKTAKTQHQYTTLKNQSKQTPILSSSLFIKGMFDKLLKAIPVMLIFARSYEGNYPNWYNLNLHCEYHALPSNLIENCQPFKHKVQSLLSRGAFKFDNTLTPNVATNPLPDHLEPRINVISIENRQ